MNLQAPIVKQSRQDLEPCRFVRFVSQAAAVASCFIYKCGTCSPTDPNAETLLLMSFRPCKAACSFQVGVETHRQEPRSEHLGDMTNIPLSSEA